MIAIAAAFAALLMMCWVLFTLAVYALPFFVAVSAGMFAYQTGAGAVGAALVGLLAGIAALLLGQTLFAHLRSPVLRAALASAYAAPAAVAGYHAIYGLAGLGSPSATWHELLSIAGAFLIGLVAWRRMGTLAGAGPDSAPLPQGAAGGIQAINKG
jgi:hypothetical protein